MTSGFVAAIDQASALLLVPFTISHAAAALPAHRLARRLPLDALVLGTMSPDFEYVLRLAVRGRFGHTPLGLVLFCVPVTLIAWWAFRAVVRPALLPLLPAGLVPSPDPEVGRHREWRMVALAALAALLGALTHVFWDGITHHTGWFVNLVPDLRRQALVLGTTRPWYNLLQHTSTLVGGAVLIAWTLSWLRRHPPEARRFAPGQGRRLARVAVSVLAFATLAAVLNGSRATGAGVEWMLGYAAVAWMAGVAVGLFVYGMMARRGTTGE